MCTTSPTGRPWQPLPLKSSKPKPPTPLNLPNNNEAYYDPAESQRANSAYRDYYDMAYNDPYYYNYGRFGFGSGISSFGPSYGMGLSYGWPTSFGSMSVGYGMGMVAALAMTLTGTTAG
jgi:hypothetical protein